MADPTTLHVSKIDGISPFNARKTPLTPEARAELKASIAEKGVIQPILVRREGEKVMALDGGSRWTIARELASEVDPADALRMERVGTVPVTWIECTDAEAAEASLISFVQRSDLHPVDEFERFVELQETHGFDAPRIARETGKGLRFVQERLRLARLAPVVREAWRKGEIEADAARAFSASESAEAQAALLKQLKKEQNLSAHRIRYELRRDHLRLTSKEMLYIGVDAYVAAGGRLDEQLLEEESYALDAPLARKLAWEKMQREAVHICTEEGWGIVLSEEDVDDQGFEEREEYDFADEKARHDEIVAKYSYQRTAEENAELESIITRAVLRAVPQHLRASRAIIIQLGVGGVEVTRNLVRIADEKADPDEDQGEGEFDEDAEPRERTPKTAPAPEPERASEPQRKGARAVLDETCNEALQKCVQAWPVLALTYAVAAMGCLSLSDAAIDLAIHPRRNFKPSHPVTIKIKDLRFSQALPICAQETNADLMDAFCELVGAAIDTGRLTDFTPGQLLIGVARDYDVRTELNLAFDAQAYFDASTKQAAVDLVRTLYGPQHTNEVADMKKGDAAKRAAEVAKDHAWLPPMLADACPPRAPEPDKPKDTRTTAQAMADAIDADQARDPFKAFLENLCVRREGAKIKSKKLYLAYCTRMALESVEPMSIGKFGDAIAEAGIAKKRTNDGVYYLDITLASDDTAEAAQ